jgi:hypothetical protein
MRDASEIRFGIEMETLLPTGTCQVGQYHHGTQVAGLPRGWNAQHDGSLHTSLPGYAGVEIVSPILKGADGLRQIAEVCTWLAAKNARVNETCGFHVHVEWPHADLHLLQALVNQVANFEDALFAVTGTPARKTSTFTKPIKDSKRDTPVAAGSHIAPAFSDRYQTLNLTNLLYNAKPTVEFRVFAGTTSALKIAGYVQMCLALVQKAEKGRLIPWDARPALGNVDTSARARLAADNKGRAELLRFEYAMLWDRKTGAFGLIADSPFDRKDVRRELARLAAKYDTRTQGAA